MQPSSSTGRKARLALLPVSWLIAFGVVAGILMIIASIRGTTTTQLLRTHTLWPLVIILPALAFGKVLGLITINLIAHATPLRRIFEQECKDTGRHGFARSTLALAWVALVLLTLTGLGAVVFLSFSP